jgi:uncharacterized protein (TIGR03084 family)
MSDADIFEDLVAEYDRIEAILAGLSEDDWLRPSAAAGWNMADVVLHLAQSEENVVRTLAEPLPDRSVWNDRSVPMDEAVERQVQEERTDAASTFQRWRSARRAAAAALRAADPDKPVRWAAAPLRPRTLATTRLAEHWAHALDIVEPLGIAYPDTARLHHIAWLGHRTLPYGFQVKGLEPQPVFADLVGPSGESWQFGDPTAPSTITGDAGAFCRVGAQRLPPERSGLGTTGPHGAQALRALRNYAA